MNEDSLYCHLFIHLFVSYWFFRISFRKKWFSKKLIVNNALETKYVHDRLDHVKPAREEKHIQTSIVPIKIMDSFNFDSIKLF